MTGAGLTGLAVRGLLARRRRLAGTFLAVFIGVSFLAGALVLGSTLARNFDSLFADANAGTDAAVRSAIGSSSVTGSARGPIDAALLARVRAVPGVAAAEPVVQGYGRLLGADGKPVGSNGPPRLAGNWIATPDLNAYKLVAGRAPRADGEAVINQGAADAGGLKVGSVTELQTPAPTRVRIVGIATFGSAAGLGQATFTGLITAQAQRLVLHRADRVSTIRVAAEPGVSQDQLVRRLRVVLPRGVEAITGAQVTAEDTDRLSVEFLNTLRAFLIVFAAIALLVATFSIHNSSRSWPPSGRASRRCCARSAPRARQRAPQPAADAEHGVGAGCRDRGRHARDGDRHVAEGVGARQRRAVVRRRPRGHASGLRARGGLDPALAGSTSRAVAAA